MTISMGYQALLFCPDEKTARAVTQVLSELDFTVTPSTEPFGAVKKLMGEHFDAVVVDCDNEQNATLLFKSARKRRSNNQSALAVAVVKGSPSGGSGKSFPDRGEPGSYEAHQCRTGERQCYELPGACCARNEAVLNLRRLQHKRQRQSLSPHSLRRRRRSLCRKLQSTQVVAAPPGTAGCAFGKNSNGEYYPLSGRQQPQGCCLSSSRQQ